MDDATRFALRITAVIMYVAAAGWGFVVWRQVQATDDGGPAIGAICMATPSIGLLIGAGVVWSWTKTS